MRLPHLQELSYVHCDSNTGGLGAKWACTRFNNSSCAFQSHVHSSHVLHPSSATRSLILDVSTCNMMCRLHEDPTNGPTDDRSMARSMQWCIFLGVSCWKHLTYSTSTILLTIPYLIQAWYIYHKMHRSVPYAKLLLSPKRFCSALFRLSPRATPPLASQL